MFASYLEERNVADEVDAVLVFLDVGVAERAMPVDQGRLADGTCAFLAEKYRFRACLQGIACLLLAIGNDDLKALALLKAIFPLPVRAEKDAVLFLGGESRLEETGQGEEEFLPQVPSFRLPREVINKEVQTVQDMGVKFKTDVLVGATIKLDELLKEYDAVYIGSGAGLPMMLGIPGENGVGVYSANEFLTRINLMQAYKFPQTDTPVQVGKHVVVLGGGNSAMDAARCAMRLQPETVTIAYRRSREEMPARAAEVEHAQEEGIQFEYLVTPKEILQDEQGRVTGIRFTRNQLGEPDERGRRRPVEIPGSDFVQPADTVITAIGQRPNPTIAKTTPALKTTERGVIALNEKGETSMPGVYAGGDIIRGGATVLLAMNDGIAAAGRINEYLKGK